VIEQIGRLAQEHLDLGAVAALAAAALPLPSGSAGVFPDRPIRGDGPGLALARDEAFSFYYEDSLDLLAACGARLLPFSPLREPDLPPGSRGLYLGGGFPELFGERLAANRPLIEAVTTAAAGGLPIYAECGGLMYLARSLTDFEGRAHRLTGLLPCDVAMAHRRSALGYVRLRARRDTLLATAGTELRGHEFHWSRLTTGAEHADAFEIVEPDRRLEGFARGSVLASYVHLHFGAAPDLARRFVAAL
jgi:cobyrinic acid a,c-diamide synthase